MMVVCKIEEEKNNLIKLSLISDDLDEALSQTCEQSHFCEKLPEMMREILNILHTKYNQNITDVECKTEFDLAKHITTYRIFKSFIQGLV